MAGLPLALHLDILLGAGVAGHGGPGRSCLRTLHERPKMKAIDHASRPHGAADEQHFVLPALMQPLLGPTDGPRVPE